MPIKRKHPDTMLPQASLTTKTYTRQKRLDFQVLNKEDKDEDGEDLYSANDMEEEELYTSPNKPPSQPVSQQSSLPSVNLQTQLDFANTSS